MRRLHAAALVALALALVAPAPARAEGPDDVTAARELFVEGATLARAGRWAEARDRYALSLAKKRAAITLYSLGVAQKESGRLVDALASFRAFLAEPSAPATASYEAPAASAIAEIERRAPRVTIVVEPRDVAGQVVLVDGVEVAPSALGSPLAVDPGAHTIVAKAEGRADAKASIVVPEGGAATVTLTLSERPAAPPTAAPAPPVAPPPPPPQAPSRALPFALIGCGAGLFVGGLTLGLLGLQQANDAPTRDGSEASAARTKAIAGDVLAGMGIAAAATGVVLLIVRRSPAPPAKAAALEPWIGVASAGVRARF